MKLRTDDINFVLETIISNSDARLFEFQIRIDTNRIGIIGHSLGGSAALAMPWLREDIAVVVALESPFLFDIVGVENDEFLWLEQEIPVPVLNIYSDSAWKNLSSWPQYERNVELLESANETIQNVYLPGAGHFSLSDLSLASPLLVSLLEGGKPEIEYRDYLQQVNQLVLEFADLYLNKDK
jgi:predicted dienelactone hydrolase